MSDLIRETAAPARSTSAPPAAPLAQFLAVVRARRRPIVGLALAAAAAAGTFSVLRTRQWASSASFMPQAKNQAAGLSALAAQYGVSVGTGNTQDSPAFYSDLLTSRAILEQVVDARYRASAGGAAATLAELYEVRGRTPALRRVETVKELRKHVGVTVVPRSGIIRVSVATPDASVSQQAARHLLALLNDFNLNTRRSQAKAERQFAEQRLAGVRGELRAAEDRLNAFYVGNRVYENSPTLTLAQTRLTRELELHRSLFATLSQQLEQAKLDEVRDTPVITVLEQPDLPLRPEPRGTVRLALFALIGGGVVGVLAALLVDTLRRALGAPGAPGASASAAVPAAAPAGAAARRRAGRRGEPEPVAHGGVE